MNNKAVLDIQGLSVKLDNKTLLSDISLHVNAGEVVSIIGPNGAGKTSLLRAISGDISLQEGSILFNNKPLDAWGNMEKARLLAVLTQSNSLSFAFTVSEVIALGRTPHSTGFNTDNQYCAEAMDALNVLHLSKRLYPTLSGGEQQRVQLARVLVQIWREEGDFKRLLLLDEPVTSLDIGHQSALMKIVKKFATTGVAVVMVVHDVTLAATYSNRLIALKNGCILAQGSPEQLITESQISQLFDTNVSIITHPDTGKPIVINN